MEENKENEMTLEFKAVLILLLDLLERGEEERAKELIKQILKVAQR